MEEATKIKWENLTVVEGTKILMVFLVEVLSCRNRGQC